jgi:hypothetical protein
MPASFPQNVQSRAELDFVHFLLGRRAPLRCSLGARRFLKGTGKQFISAHGTRFSAKLTFSNIGVFRDVERLQKPRIHCSYELARPTEYQ